jgi:hypothetical protein
MGTGDPDLYKAFEWRFWNLICADGGRVGVVLPRSAFAAKGSALFRKSLFANATAIDLTMLLNRGGWVFDEAEHRYTIALAVIARGIPIGETIGLRGPFASLAAFQQGHDSEPARFTSEDVLSWNDTASLPLLPTEQSLSVFSSLRKAPRLDLNDGTSWRARPDTEMHATNQKDLMEFVDERPDEFWPVFKGESFDTWEPDNGPTSYYAWAETTAAINWLYSKRLRSGGGKRKDPSAHSEFPLKYRQDKKTLACYRPRIAFRDISRATDTRTVRAALVPADVFLTNKAPYLLWPRGDEKDQAYLLGVLCSIPLDWYARRFVETNLNYFIFNPLPIPRPDRRNVLWGRTVELAGRLAAPDKRFADWAKKVGVKCGRIPADEKQDMIAELDAVVARLYGLSKTQLVHIFETFHEGWDYESHLKVVLKHFANWRER